MLACACNLSILGDTAKLPWTPGWSKLQWDPVLKYQSYYRKLSANTIKRNVFVVLSFEVGSHAVHALELEDDLELLILLPLSPSAVIIGIPYLAQLWRTISIIHFPCLFTFWVTMGAGHICSIHNWMVTSNHENKIPLYFPVILLWEPSLLHFLF